MNNNEKIEKLSKEVIAASQLCNICRDLLLESISENGSIYQRYRAAENFLIAQGKLLELHNKLSCATIDKLKYLLDEQTFISKILLEKSQNV